MRLYKSKHTQLPGTSFSEVIGLARREYHLIQKKTPRRAPYVRSKYFTKDKIFISTFWDHLNQKIQPERVRRLKLYSCALDLIRNSQSSPDIIHSKTEKDIVRIYICISNKKVKIKGLPQCGSMTTGRRS